MDDIVKGGLMMDLTLQPDPGNAAIWWFYGLTLCACICGSLMASRRGRHVQATLLAAFVWAGATAPIAVFAISLPGKTGVLISPLAGLTAVGLFLVYDALRKQHRHNAPPFGSG
jgi:hypothetical protein